MLQRNVLPFNSDIHRCRIAIPFSLSFATPPASAKVGSVLGATRHYPTVSNFDVSAFAAAQLLKLCDAVDGRPVAARDEVCVVAMSNHMHDQLLISDVVAKRRQGQPSQAET